MSAPLSHVDQHPALDKPRDLVARIAAAIKVEQDAIEAINAQLDAISSRKADPEEVLRGNTHSTRDALIEATRPHHARIAQLQPAQRQAQQQLDDARSAMANKVLANEMAPALCLNKALQERLKELQQTNDAMHGEINRLERMGLSPTTYINALSFYGQGTANTCELITASLKDLGSDADRAARYVSVHKEG